MPRHTHTQGRGAQVRAKRKGEDEMGFAEGRKEVQPEGDSL